jgi:hypothetical protein
MKIIFVILCLFLGFTVAEAATKDTRDIAVYGTRTIGMGGAFVGVANGPEAVFTNPAGIPSSSYTSFSLEQGKSIALPFYSLAIENPFEWKNSRFGYVFSQSGGFDRTILNSETSVPERIGSFGYTLHSLFWSNSAALAGPFSAALWWNATYESLATQNAVSGGLHLGLYAPFEAIGAQWGWGVQAKNLLATPVMWSTGYRDSLPQTFSMGLSSVWMSQLRIAADINYTPTFGYAYASGAEWWVSGREHEINAMALRVGLNNGSFTAGVGIYMQQLSFNYAYIQSQYVVIEPQHRFAVGWAFLPDVQKTEMRFSPPSLFKEWEASHR